MADLECKQTQVVHLVILGCYKGIASNLFCFLRNVASSSLRSNTIIKTKQKLHQHFMNFLQDCVNNTTDKNEDHIFSRAFSNLLPQRRTQAHAYTVIKVTRKYKNVNV